MSNISYTVSVYNETKEIERLVEVIREIKTTDDELVILHTYRNESEQSTQIFKDIENACKCADKYEIFHFQNNFSNMKNTLNELATKDYIFNFDADEFITIDTLKLWKSIIESNDNDLYYVPRINTVEKHSIEDVKNYNWKINEYGWINWPDYQPRIFKNNADIIWSGDVHETIKGCSKAVALPSHPSLAIIHHKAAEKQRSQNAFYDSIKR